MVRIDIEYLGDLHTKCIHGPSGQELLTDAPVDNRGKGEFFSPTDLLATASASCIATIMGIKAKDIDIDIKGMTISVDKEMTNVPYRHVQKLTYRVVFPHKLNQKDFTIMKNVIRGCPVTRSLDPSIELDITYEFADDINP